MENQNFGNRNANTIGRYYAPAASTVGDKVKIYRYALDSISRDYRELIDSESSPLQKALLREEWARLIETQIDLYTGDKSRMRLMALGLARIALETLEETRRETLEAVAREQRMRRACKSKKRSDKSKEQTDKSQDRTVSRKHIRTADDERKRSFGKSLRGYAKTLSTCSEERIESLRNFIVSIYASDKTPDNE